MAKYDLAVGFCYNYSETKFLAVNVKNIVDENIVDEDKEFDFSFEKNIITEINEFIRQSKVGLRIGGLSRCLVSYVSLNGFENNLIGYIKDKLTFISEGTSIGRKELSLKLNPLLAQNGFYEYAPIFGPPLNSNANPISFNIKFLYAQRSCYGNCDSSIKYYHDSDYKGSRKNFELTFFYSILFTGTNKKEILTVTVSSLNNMVQWVENIDSTHKYGIIPPHYIQENLDFEQINKDVRYILTYNHEKFWDVGASTSIHEFMLNAAMHLNIEDLNYQ